MDEREKCGIRLAHWKDHNIEHVKGYEEVANVIEGLGIAKAPEMIRRAICFMEAANVEFEKALKLLRSAEGSTTDQQQTVHEHEHCHQHEHGHDHEHEHCDQHEHEHCAAHGHDHEHHHEHGHDHCHKSKP